jgi:hypothetical protein
MTHCLDINPTGDCRYTPAVFDMCCALHMPCGARGIDIISNLSADKYIDLPIAKYRIAKQYIEKLPEKEQASLFFG